VTEQGLAKTFQAVCQHVDGCPTEPETYNGVDDTDGCPDSLPDKPVLEPTRIVIPQLYFFFDRTELKPESQPVLDDIAKLILAHAELKKIRIVGHADSHGEEAYNDDLSSRRAGTVLQELVRRGVAAQRLESLGKGEREPLVSPERTEQDAQANRRVEFLILERVD